MKRVYLPMLLILLVAGDVVAAPEQLREMKAQHFIIYYPAAHTVFAREVAAAAEKYYRTIAGDLGYVRYDNFWQWDKRVRIVIYTDHQAYIRQTGRQSWSHGMADYSRKIISSYVGGKDFVDRLLPHEIGHLVFRDFVGFQGVVPLWLDEGVAQRQEKKYRQGRREQVGFLYQSGEIISLQEMMALDIRNITPRTEARVRVVGGSAPAGRRMMIRGNDLVERYYVQAFSLVDFMIECYGGQSFVMFCRQLRDGKSLNNALRSCYGRKLRTITDLERQWLEYIKPTQ